MKWYLFRVDCTLPLYPCPINSTRQTENFGRIQIPSVADNEEMAKNSQSTVSGGGFTNPFGNNFKTFSLTVVFKIFVWIFWHKYKTITKNWQVISEKIVLIRTKKTIACPVSHWPIMEKVSPTSNAREKTHINATARWKKLGRLRKWEKMSNSTLLASQKNGEAEEEDKSRNGAFSMERKGERGASSDGDVIIARLFLFFFYWKHSCFHFVTRTILHFFSFKDCWNVKDHIKKTFFLFNI